MSKMNFKMGTPEWLQGIISSDEILLGIGDLSHASGVSIAQLRYWTEKKYISSAGQDEGNRKYTYDTVFRVRAIKAYLDEGFTLVAAAKHMHDHREVVNIIKNVLLQRLEEVFVDDDGSQVVRLGTFDPDPKKELIARSTDDGTRFELLEKTDK